MARKTQILFGFLIIGMIAAAYFPALSIPLRGDDFDILNNAYSGWREPTSLLTRNINNFFRPVVKLSLLIDYSCAATRATWYNVTTLAIHLLNVWLLYVLLMRGSRWPVAAIIAFLFGISSYYGEVTLWATGRTDSLMLLFALTGFLLLEQAQNGLSRWRHAALVLLCAGAMGAKETWVLFPALFALFLWLMKGVSPMNILKLLWPVFTLLLAYVAVSLGLPMLAGTAAPTSYATATPREGLLKFCSMLAMYAGGGALYAKTFWQTAIILAGVIGVIFWLLWTRNRLGGFGMAWMLLTMLIALPIQYAPSRYNYLPLIGFWMMIVAVADDALRRLRAKHACDMRLARGAIGLILVMYGAYHAMMLQAEIADYARHGAFHQRLIEMYQPIKGRVPSEKPIIFINRGEWKPLPQLANSIQGYPKLFFVRGAALWQLVYFDALANFLETPFTKRVVPVNPADAPQTLGRPCAVILFDDAGFRIEPNDAPYRRELLELRRLHGRLPDNVSLYQTQ